MLLRNVLLINNFTRRYQRAVLAIVNQKINQFKFDQK